MNSRVFPELHSAAFIRVLNRPGNSAAANEILLPHCVPSHVFPDPLNASSSNFAHNVIKNKPMNHYPQHDHHCDDLSGNKGTLLQSMLESARYDIGADIVPNSE